MPIAKSLAEKMGGTLTFESEQDVGTTFYLTVPFRIAQEGAEPEEPEEDEQDADITGMHVLLAEDNALNQEIAEFLLETAGASVVTVGNGQEAVDRFRTSRPGEFDVILMDVMMPELDGYKAAGLIRALDRPDAATVPIIAMTANAFTEDRRRAFEAGMNDHQAKPLDPVSLRRAIAKYRKK